MGSYRLRNTVHSVKFWVFGSDSVDLDFESLVRASSMQEVALPLLQLLPSTVGFS